MARKKPAGGAQPDRSPSRTIFARISPEMEEALNAYMQSLRPRPSITAVIEMALEDLLAGKGFWPSAGRARSNHERI
jgi:hypothetical protein